MERKFGVELEIINVSRQEVLSALQNAGIAIQDESYNHTTRKHWKIVSDASVSNGFEVVSPVLTGESGLTKLRIVMNTLENIQAKVDRSCGLHVHFDAANFSVDNIRTIVKRYAKFEQQIDSFMPPSRRGNRFCASLTSVVEKIAFQRADTVQKLALAQNGRYYKVNLQSYYVHGTIEFRQHSGTVEATKAINWIRFLDAFIKSSINPQSTISNLNLSNSLRGVQAKLANMLLAGPVTLETMQSHFTWLDITARAAITRLRKAGLNISAIKINDKPAYILNNNSNNDSLFAGINAELISFYQTRTAKFANF